MKIIVCIKQVPLVEQLKFDPDAKRLVRDGVPSEINAFDKRAITRAVELKKEFGVAASSRDMIDSAGDKIPPRDNASEVVVITMGPPQARDALYEALAMGADRAVHLLGKEFAGADTLATARALARACQKIGYDLIFCGKYSTDAETAQVPPMLAEFLDAAQVMGATKVQVNADGKSLTIVRELDDGFETLECAMPAVLSAAERLCKPARATPEDLQAAKQKEIEIIEPSALASDLNLFGAAGSPTWVTEIYSIEPKRRRVLRVADGNADAVTQEVVRDLAQAGAFGASERADAELFAPGEQNLQGESIWVIAEINAGKIRLVTFELLGRATQLAGKIGGNVAAVLIGHNVSHLAKTLAAYGATRVYLADAPALSAYATETHTAILADAIRAHHPYAALIPSTANGRDLAPRVAARLNIGLTGDCIGLEIDDQKRLVQLKPAFGGNIVAPILTKTRPAMATIRAGMLRAAAPDPGRKAKIEQLPVDKLGAPRTRITATEMNTPAGVELDSARAIVVVGMGVGAPENLPVVYDLAAVLRAPLGATRRVVDAGWLPRQLQIGLTGRSVAPRLYITIGVSGKFNHTVGMQRAEFVLAINNNPDADIFKHADYGIVGDWAVVVPALTRAFKNARA